MTERPVDVETGGGRQERRIVDYPSNSKRLKEVKIEDQPKREKIEPVVVGAVVKRKRGLATRLFGDVIAEDSTTIFEYLVTDVFVPAFRNMIVDFVTEGIQKAVYGDSRPRSSTGRPGYTTYSNRFVQGRPAEQRPSITRTARSNHNFQDVILVDRADAEQVLDGLRELVERFGMASVSEFYELIGITADFTDNKYGWMDLRDARIVQTRGGWAFSLPRTEPLTT